jgi:hypothetical protein
MKQNRSRRISIIEPSNHTSSYQLSITLPTQLQFDVCSLKIAIYKLNKLNELATFTRYSG